MNRYLCIHGHFYQPPRENPWLEEIELQVGAQPYHDWNERIADECYAPNTASRILDSEKRIVDIVNNYSKINFNFGPTLLSWMQTHSPDTYKAILEADQLSQKRFSGHGAALAQAYNHMIMPLANTRDEHTQVIWGIKDFEHRFNRKPEGMWLAETAVNTESLEILAEHEIQFTILAPRQAKRIRKIGENEWKDVSHGNVNTHNTYLCRLPSGKSIHLFFYDGSIAQEIAFGKLLRSGKDFADRLMDTFSVTTDQPQLAHVATDGETYGHHHRFGDMALAFCLHHIESNNLAQITLYGEYLEKHPPAYEVEIVEDSSWSCIHGVERWKSNCGCCSGLHMAWHQEWRAPLRAALDWVRDSLIKVYEKEMSAFTDDPWQLRNDYIDVMLDRSAKSVYKFFEKNIKREVSQEEKVKILRLLEMQRYAMLMYTSCGWFFDEISGIETTQILQYAARTIQLARDAANVDLEGEFMKRLGAASSNIPDLKNGSIVYERYVKPAVVDLLRVGVHYAVSSLFEDYSETAKIYCFTTQSEIAFHKEAGKQRMAIGKVHLYSHITHEEDTVSFAVLHLGDHNIYGGVRPAMRDDIFGKMANEIKTAFLKSNIPEVIQSVTSHFGTNNYSLKHLFKDEQNKILNEILKSTLQDIESHYRQIYEQHYPLLQAQEELTIPLPKALATSIEFVLNRDLLDQLNKDRINVKQLQKTVEEVKRWSFDLDKNTLGFTASHKINNLMQKLLKTPDNVSLITNIESLLSVLSGLQLPLDIWKAQNVYFKINKQFYKQKKTEADQSDSSSKKWINLFDSIGCYLHVKCQ